MESRPARQRLQVIGWMRNLGQRLDSGGRQFALRVEEQVTDDKIARNLRMADYKQGPTGNSAIEWLRNKWDVLDENLDGIFGRIV